MQKGKKHNRCLIHILAISLLISCITIYIAIVNEYNKDVHSILHYPKLETNKPNFIIHVGPPKTATTYLQTELKSWEDTLRTKDNLAYVGKYITKDSKNGETLGPFVRFLRDEKCQKKARDASSNPPQCWSRFLQSLNQYKVNHQSIMVSDEVFSFQHKFHIQWDLLHKALSESGWNMIVIIAYRRYSDRLVSQKQQLNRWAKSKPVLNSWPGIRKGRSLNRTMDWINDALQKSIPDYQRMIDTISKNESNIDLRILDIHNANYTSVRTNLFCHVLDDITVNACQESQLNDSTYQQPKVVINPRQSEFYDALSTAAAKNGLLGNDLTRYDRHNVTLGIQHQQETVFNKASLDFVLDCPTRSELKRFLDASLAAERHLARRGYIQLQSDKHEESFWNNTIQYCWINTTAVLAMDDWVTYFQRLVEKTNTKRRA